MGIAEIILREYAWILLWWLNGILVGVAALVFIQRHTDRQIAGNLPSELPMKLPLNLPLDLPLELLVFFSFTTGLVIQIAILIALASINLLYSQAVIIAFALVLAVAIWVIFKGVDLKERPGWIRWPSAKQYLEVLPVILLIGAWALKPLGPAMEHDELSYHLPYARFYLEQAGLAVNEYLRFPLHTHNFNMLFTLALMRDSVPMTHLMHASAGFATLLAVHGVARRQYGSIAAFLAVLLCLGWGELTRSFGNAYVDLGLMLFVVASAFALMEWDRLRINNWLILAGVFAGAAIGTKYFGLIFAAMLALWVLWSSRSLRKFVIFCAVSAVVGAFWYVRSWLISGNPLHPFLGEVFGFYIWSKEHLLGQMSELKSHGVERTVVNLLRLPELFYASRTVFHGYIRLDWLLLALFYSAVLLSWRFPRSWRPLVGLSAAFLVFWFCSAQILRYLLPVVPLMALAASAALIEVARLCYRPKRSPPLQWLHTLNHLKLPVIIALSIYYGAQHWRVDLFHVPISAESQHRFLTENNSGYELFRAAAADPRIKEGPLLQLNHAGSIFFFPGLIYGDWNGPHAWLQYLYHDAEGNLRVIPPERMAASLQESGIRGVVFSFDPDERFFPQNRADYDQYFDLVFENRFGFVMVPKAADVKNDEY